MRCHFGAPLAPVLVSVPLAALSAAAKSCDFLEEMAIPSYKRLREVEPKVEVEAPVMATETAPAQLVGMEAIFTDAWCDAITIFATHGVEATEEKIESFNLNFKDNVNLQVSLLVFC